MPEEYSAYKNRHKFQQFAFGRLGLIWSNCRKQGIEKESESDSGLLLYQDCWMTSTVYINWKQLH